MSFSQLMIGSLLGDGSISKAELEKYGFRYQEDHGLKQKEYLEWKVGLFEFSGNFGKHKNRDAYYFISKRTTDLKDYFSLKYENRNGFLELIKKLDFFGFLIWFMDDGSLNYSYKNVYSSIPIYKFGGNDITYSVAEEAKCILNEKFGLGFHVLQQKNRVVGFSVKNSTGYLCNLHLNSKETRMFLKMIEDSGINVPNCMKYKTQLNQEKLIESGKYYEWRKIKNGKCSSVV